MYYGGEPPAWILEPPIPTDALFDKALLEPAAPPSTSAAATGELTLADHVQATPLYICCGYEQCLSGVLCALHHNL